MYDSEDDEEAPPMEKKQIPPPKQVRPKLPPKAIVMTKPVERSITLVTGLNKHVVKNKDLVAVFH